MEDATRLVPTLSGATSAVARMAIYSARMDEAAIVSTPMITNVYCKFSFTLDVNECGIQNGDCAHLCMDFTGGHVCSCFKGFLLINGSNCTGELFS